jgi:hypothetical protein
MMQVFRWPNRGPHRDRFLIIIHSAVWHTLDRLTVNVAVVPFPKIMTFDPRAIINTLGEVNVYSGTARKASGDDDNPELAFKLALNRAIRTALASLGLSDVWDETYHARKRGRGMRTYRLNPEGQAVTDWIFQATPAPRCETFLDQLDRVPRHAVAQRAAIILDYGFRRWLELHYGKTNTVDGRIGWTPVHAWPKPDYEGEPDDLETRERCFFDDGQAVEAFILRAKELLNIAR